MESSPFMTQCLVKKWQILEATRRASASSLLSTIMAEDILLPAAITAAAPSCYGTSTPGTFVWKCSTTKLQWLPSSISKTTALSSPAVTTKVSTYITSTMRVKCCSTCPPTEPQLPQCWWTVKATSSSLADWMIQSVCTRSWGAPTVKSTPCF